MQLAIISGASASSSSLRRGHIDTTTVGLADLDSNRNAAPHAPVHVARAAAAQQHSQLHLLKLALLQAGHLAVISHQVLACLGVPDVAREGTVSRRCVALGPAVAWPHHTCASRVGPHVSLQATCAGY